MILMPPVMINMLDEFYDTNTVTNKETYVSYSKNVTRRETA